MFNTYVQHKSAEYHSHTHNVTEKRAPTDESVRLLREYAFEVYERIFLDELQPETGDYQTEPEIQCGIFCEMANNEIAEQGE